MGALEDLQQQVALLQAQVNALPQVGSQLQHVSLLDDVKIGAVLPLADTHALVWSDATHAWVNGTGGGRTPTAWATYTASTSSSYSSNSAHDVTWAIDSADTHNSPVTYSSGTFTIATSGWYTVSGFVRCAGVPNVTGYTAFSRNLIVSRGYTADGDAYDTVQDENQFGVNQESTNHQTAQSDWGKVYYLLADDTIRVNVEMYSASGTGTSWQVTGGAMRVETLPM